MIIFRADISPHTGLQQLRSCTYLASLLKKNNQVMICSKEDKKTAKFLVEKSIRFSMVKDPAKFDNSAVKAIIFVVAPFSSQDALLLEKAKNTGIKTVQIVSAGAELQTVDIAFSPLLQTENALLHHKFRHFNQARRKYRKHIKNIFINLGDLLPYRDLRQIIDTLHRLHLKMKIMPGLNLKKADKRNLLKIYPGIHFCGKSESPARAYFEADLALVPAGEAALEAAVVGTPALYFYQEPGSENLAQFCVDKEIGLKFGKLEDLNIDSFRNAIAPLTLERREQIGEAGRQLVDGLGVQRFFKVLQNNGIIKNV